ncbi:MAG: chaperonin GroEL [Planctomycetaceae bacterium]|nr:chaperonin GroEL [Planctomycetaceae bacterium]
MPHKRILFRADARERILRGATTLADAVRVTLGPKSKCVLIEKKWGPPLVCNDGVTIVKEIELEDPEENLGAHMLREAAERTADVVGDGTTTATLLAQAILAAGLRNLAAGASAVDIKRGLDRGLTAAVAALRALSRPVASRLEKAQVATISAHNDAALGAFVADAMERVGSEGVVTVEEAKGMETSIEIVDGMQFDRGLLSPYFITDAERQQAVLDRPLILFHEGRIASLKEFLPFLETLVPQRRPLVVIAESVEAEALATLVVNRLRGVLECVAAKAPGYGDRRKEMMQDMAILTGGRFISADLGVTLDAVQIADLGTAEKVTVDRETTTIIGGQGDKAAIQARCTEIRRQITEAKSDYDREQFEQRLAKLSGGVAIIRVGAPTEAELKSRKEALADAISATRAAIAEGIVPGGGLALLRAIPAVEREEAACDGDERTGVRILRQVLEVPARTIAENSAADGGVVVGELRRGSGDYGFDAARGVYGDLVAAGIVDPTKVVRIALENAVSVAGTLLLTEATLTEVKDEKTTSLHPEIAAGLEG